MKTNKIIFLSGANITSGGPLQVFQDFIGYLSSREDVEITAIVSDVNLFCPYPNVKYIEIKLYKRFIFLKFYFEYCYFYFLSKKYKIDLWLSLNDCTPSVRAERRAVYCHNATPFYKRSWKDVFNPSRALLQSFYYIIFYKINISKNSFIIVQQQWLKDFFIKKFNLKSSGIVICQPYVAKPAYEVIGQEKRNKGPFVFIYPTKAQPYKNIEVILKAAKRLNHRSDFRILLTVKGDENGYIKSLFDEYKHLEAIEWMGHIDRKELEIKYKQSNTLIFSSKLETWGLPISEFKSYGNPILLADLPYAHETLGNYGKAKFFDADDADELSVYMEGLIDNQNFNFDKTEVIELSKPLATTIKELFDILFQN